MESKWRVELSSFARHIGAMLAKQGVDIDIYGECLTKARNHQFATPDSPLFLTSSTFRGKGFEARQRWWPLEYLLCYV